MNRAYDCEMFIKKIAQIMHENPDIECDKRFIYSNLITNGIQEKKSIQEFFDYWTHSFRKDKKYDVFVSAQHSYFCQFVSKDNPLKKNHIKLYFALDKEHIKEGAKMIFEFMSDNGIKSISKIGSDERNDNIVIRVFDERDAEKINQFVSSNSYLQSGKLPLNPFSFQNGSLAYAMDGLISYNSEVSQIISSYLNLLKTNNRLGEASLDGFKKYTSYLYDEIFVNGNEMLLQDYMINRSQYFNNSGNNLLSLCNHMQVMQLFISALETNDFNTFLSHTSYINSHNSQGLYSDHIKRLYPQMGSLKDETFNIQEILNYVLEETYKKYPSYDYNLLSTFCSTGNYGIFTRSNNARSLAEKHLTKENVSKLIISEFGSLDCKSYVTKYNLTKSSATIDVDALIWLAIKTTINKYGSNQLKHALRESLNGNFKFFTNDYNSRSNLMMYTNPEIIREFILKNLIQFGININETDIDYVDTLVDCFINFSQSNCNQKINL